MKIPTPEQQETSDCIQKAMVNHAVEGLPTPKFWFGNVVGYWFKDDKPKAGIVIGLTFKEFCGCGFQGWHYALRLMEAKEGELLKETGEEVNGIREDIMNKIIVQAPQ